MQCWFRADVPVLKQLRPEHGLGLYGRLSSGLWQGWGGLHCSCKSIGRSLSILAKWKYADFSGYYELGRFGRGRRV
jgi:hypothetical protein